MAYISNLCFIYLFIYEMLILLFDVTNKHYATETNTIYIVLSENGLIFRIGLEID